MGALAVRQAYKASVRINEYDAWYGVDRVSTVGSSRKLMAKFNKAPIAGSPKRTTTGSQFKKRPGARDASGGGGYKGPRKPYSPPQDRHSDRSNQYGDNKKSSELGLSLSAKPSAEPSQPDANWLDAGTFETLGLSEQILSALTAKGFTNPTPIQARAIPVLLEGRDLIGQAQTGSGKTGAFALPLLQKLDTSRSVTQVLVLVPTRELAMQVAKAFHEFAAGSPINVAPIYGGQPIDRQFRALRAGAHVVVGTPGRVLDHLNRRSLDLSGITTCILDEADEMLALGFADDLEAILGHLPAQRQTAMFSATMPPRIVDLAGKMLNNPERITVRSKARTLDSTSQGFYEAERGAKISTLCRVLQYEEPGQAIIFCRTRNESSELSDSLRDKGFAAEALHGEMAQSERDRVMSKFKGGAAQYLVATDVAARGIDIDTVTHVVNYDLPFDTEQYIHRIGRTGRAGRSGSAISIIYRNERSRIGRIEKAVGARIAQLRTPSEAEIAEKRRVRFAESVASSIGGDLQKSADIVRLLSEEHSLETIAAAAIKLLWEAQFGQESAMVEVPAEAMGGSEELGMTQIFVGIGKESGLRPGDIVAVIANEAGVRPDDIGRIDINERFCLVDVKSTRAEETLNALRRATIKRRKVKVQYAASSGSGPSTYRSNPNPRFDR